VDPAKTDENTPQPSPLTRGRSPAQLYRRRRSAPRCLWRQVEQGVKYVYETGHCGLTYDLDFDGSFWRAVDPDGGKEPPPFFINYDKGYITLISEDEARYEASTGEEVVLRRIEGPVVIGGCGQPTMGEPTLTPIPTTATD
jgi:hypothetical protein